MQNLTEAGKLNLLVNHIDAAVYEIISEVASFEDTVELLSHAYATTPSPIFAHSALMTCKQQTGESLDSYLQKLKRTSIDCNFKLLLLWYTKKKPFEMRLSEVWYQIKLGTGYWKTTTLH